MILQLLQVTIFPVDITTR